MIEKKMEWSDIQEMTTKDIIDVFGCSKHTAKSWKSGRRTPPEWTKAIYIQWASDSKNKE